MTAPLLSLVAEGLDSVSLENISAPAIEYKLNREPTCLLEFFEALDRQHSTTLTVVWLSPNVFCFALCQSLRGGFHPRGSFVRANVKKNETEAWDLYIYNVSPASFYEVQDRIDFLFRIDDDYYEMVTWDCGSNRTILCPLSAMTLHYLVSGANTNRSNSFSSFSFTEEQCRILATGRSRMAFLGDCEFPHGGVSFVDTFARRRQKDGTVHLTFDVGSNSRLFDRDNWAEFLALPQCKYIERLALTPQLDDDLCQAVSTANVQHLVLHGALLRDQGDALGSAIAVGRGPKSISLNTSTFGFGDMAEESWRTFSRKIRGNRSLESLEFYQNFLSQIDDEVLCGIVYALKECVELRHLRLYFENVSETIWKALCDTMSNHPSLSSIEIAARIQKPNLLAIRSERAKDIYDVLHKNPRIKNISYATNLYDNVVWNERIVPVLECRQFQDRLQALKQPDCNDILAPAVLGVALAATAPKPWLTWMIIQQSQHVVACSAFDDRFPNDRSSRSKRFRRAGRGRFPKKSRFGWVIDVATSLFRGGK